MFTYDEANRRYTQRFTHTELELVEGGLPLVPVTYRPMSICTSSEMDLIFASCETWDEVLDAMHAKVGTPGPKAPRGKQFRQQHWCCTPKEH